MLHFALVGAAPSTHSRICSPSHDVSALPSCPHLEAHPVFSILPLYKLLLRTLAGYESEWHFDPRMYGDRLNLPDLPVNVHHTPFPCFAPLYSEICKKHLNSSPPSEKPLSGDDSEGRGFLPQGGGNLFENLLQAFSPTSKTHSRSRPSYSYQAPSYHQYHPPPSYAPPPQPEPIQEEPVQVVLKGQHALSDSFSPSVDNIFTKSFTIIWR